MNKLGFLVPYSGEFPELKRTLLNPVKDYCTRNNIEIIVEFIDKGDSVKVEKVIDKLFYSDEADMIIGYVGYRVSVRLFDKIKNYPHKLFVNLSMGEIIPYTNTVVNYPPNYFLVSYDAWKCEAILGKWIAENLPAQNCLICTSQYETGYSFQEAFRIGYHAASNGEAKTLQSCILKETPQHIHTDGLLEEIMRIKPDHLHVILSGKQLDDFINKFDQNIDYSPSVSFAFPVPVNRYHSQHPSLQKTFTAVKQDFLKDEVVRLADDVFEFLFNVLINKTITMLEDGSEIISNHISILEMNIKNHIIVKTDFSEELSPSLNPEFNHSAENSFSVWQNPYLCI